MNTAEWLPTKIAQIASKTIHEGGGEDKTKIDSNSEFACLARLLANCEKDEEKNYVYSEMQKYLSNANREHFEKEDLTSFDEVYDSTGNRMYIGYDEKGNMKSITTTYIDEQGVENSNKKINIDLPQRPAAKHNNADSEKQNVNKKSFVEKYLDNVKSFYSDLWNKGIKEAYTNYWGNLF